MFRRTIELTIAMSLAFGVPRAVAQVTNEIRQNHILFEAGGTTLSESAIAQIELLGEVLSHPPLDTACLRLVGYSDASGGDAVNLSIAKARAQVVADALAPLLAGTKRIEEIEGLGATNFLKELPETDRQQRRVAILARDCEPA